MIFPKESQGVTEVSHHYNELDTIYREIWGEHVHHGFWKSGSESRAQAAEALVDVLADRLAIKSGENLCDVGCGYGATARSLNTKRGAEITGLTLSQEQFERCRKSETPSLKFLQRDWLDNHLKSDTFDCVYSIESSEHMLDKQRFFDEAFRTLRPGGRFAVFAWLARSDPQRWEIDHLLEPICREGRLPSMGNEAEYRRFCTAAGFEITSFEDLSRNVRRTWWICLRRLAGKLLTDKRYRDYLSNRSAKERIFGLTIFRLIFAYRTGSMRYCLLTARKPTGLVVGMHRRQTKSTKNISRLLSIGLLIGVFSVPTETRLNWHGAEAYCGCLFSLA